MVDIKQQINNRFIATVNHLILLKKTKSKAALARELGIRPNMLSEILGGRMNVSIESLISLHKKHNTSLEFLMLGTASKEKSLDYLNIEDACTLLNSTPIAFEKYFEDKINKVKVNGKWYYSKKELLELLEELKK